MRINLIGDYQPKDNPTLDALVEDIYSHLDASSELTTCYKEGSLDGMPIPPKLLGEKGDHIISGLKEGTMKAIGTYLRQVRTEAYKEVEEILRKIEKIEDWGTEPDNDALIVRVKELEQQISSLKTRGQNDKAYSGRIERELKKSKIELAGGQRELVEAQKGIQAQEDSLSFLEKELKTTYAELETHIELEKHITAKEPEINIIGMASRNRKVIPFTKAPGSAQLGDSGPGPSTVYPTGKIETVPPGSLIGADVSSGESRIAAMDKSDGLPKDFKPND